MTVHRTEPPLPALSSEGALSRLAALLVVVSLTVSMSGCAASPDRPEWNVVLVVVDTLRADHLSLYGYERPTSPALEAFAEDAVVFDRAWSQAGCTFPSVNSILTSKAPQLFLGQPEKRIGIPEAYPSLQERLAAEGWATAAVSSSIIVRATPSKVNKHGGFGRGFETFDESCEQKPAECVNERAFELLDRLPEPFFLYLHYLEPHAPYQPPETHIESFADEYDGPGWVQRGNTLRVRKNLYMDGPDVGLTEADVDHFRALYDDEVRYFDSQLGELLERLRADGLLDRTLLVIASDHGEEIMDHGHMSHCRDLAWDTVLRTPLVIAVPSSAEPGTRTAVAQNLDIVPTILDYLRLPFDPDDLDGRSLRPLIEDDRPVHRYVFAAQGTMRAVSDGRFKLVHDLETERSRLYFLETDPEETLDVAASHPEIVALREKVLLDWVEEVEGSLARGLELSRESRAVLEALGYL